MTVTSDEAGVIFPVIVPRLCADAVVHMTKMQAAAKPNRLSF
jgi:hypothetical protein